MSAIPIKALPVSPSSQLHLSSDGEIAIGLGDTIEIFVPKVSLKDIRSQLHNKSHPEKQQDEASLWKRAKFTANLFTRTEVPIVLPLGFDTFSIGEEQSLSHVIALEWSPPFVNASRPGVANLTSGRVPTDGGKSVLAVLTSNHVLSIWVADGGRMSASLSWNRRLVVNKALAQTPSSQTATVHLLERSRLRKRIRVSCWAPILPNHTSAVNLDCHTAWLAVVNDLNQLVLLTVQPPCYNTLTKKNDKEWNAKEIICINLVESGNDDTHGRTKASLKPRFARHMVWSPWFWDEEEQCLTSAIACVLNEELLLTYCQSRKAADAMPKLDLSKTRKIGPETYQGPLRWSPNVQTGFAKLVAFTPERLVCLTIPLANSERSNGISVDSISDNNSWNMVRSIAISHPTGQAPVLQISRHMSTKSWFGHSFILPPEKGSSMTLPPWTKTVEHYRAQFSQKYNLEDNVTVKIWGLDTFGATNCTVVLFSVHPSDMIQYLRKADELSYLVIANDMSLQDAWPLPREGTSREAELFNISRFMTTTNGTPVPLDKIFSNIESTKRLENFREDDQPPEQATTEAVLDHIATKLHSPDLFIPYLREILLLEEDDRASTPSSMDSALHRLCNSILAIPDRLVRPTAQGIKIVQMARTWIAMLSEQDPLQFPSEGHSPVTDGVQATETCQICANEIPFQDPYWAQCSQGHQFGRCGLTFLAIQVPGASKSCGICGQQYLTLESCIARQDAIASVDGDPTEPQLQSTTCGPLSLAEILFVICKVCVYCGGKFIG